MKHLIPIPIRRAIRATTRGLKDVVSGDILHFVKAAPPSFRTNQPFPAQMALTQPIKVTHLSENKVHNLTLAAQSINNVIINPDQIFSFWVLIGAPTQRRGYLLGRSLVNQQLQGEYGGGLCQLSGLLYYLALQAGLNIIERHSHSVDLYDEQTRFAPLGSDATVVHGYKDLRVLNSLQQPICFHILVGADFITGQLCAAAPIVAHQIEFRTRSLEKGVEVETLQYSTFNPEKMSLGKSRYRSYSNSQ